MIMWKKVGRCGRKGREWKGVVENGRKWKGVVFMFKEQDGVEGSGKEWERVKMSNLPTKKTGFK